MNLPFKGHVSHVRKMLGDMLACPPLVLVYSQSLIKHNACKSKQTAEKKQTADKIAK